MRKVLFGAVTAAALVVASPAMAATVFEGSGDFTYINGYGANPAPYVTASGLNVDQPNTFSFRIVVSDPTPNNYGYGMYYSSDYSFYINGIEMISSENSGDARVQIDQNADAFAIIMNNYGDLVDYLGGNEESYFLYALDLPNNVFDNVNLPVDTSFVNDATFGQYQYSFGPNPYDPNISGIVYANTYLQQLTSFTITTIPDSAVPEPATWAMMIAGFGLIGGAMRQRRKVRPTVAFA